MTWDTDGSREAVSSGDTVSPGFESAKARLAMCGTVCLSWVQLRDEDAKLLLRDIIASESIVTTDGTTTYTAGFDGLLAIREDNTTLFERTEDFGQIVNSITMDGGPYSQAWRDDDGPYVFVGFEDNFVRAYNQTPKRVRAGNVGVDISGITLRENGDIIVVGSDSTGGVITSWQNDLLDYNWRISGIAGEILDVAVDFGNQEIWALIRNPDEVWRLDSSGTVKWKASLEQSPSDFDIDNNTVFVREEEGSVEFLDFNGNHVETHAVFPEGTYGLVARACGDYYYVENQGTVKRVHKESGQVDWVEYFGAASIETWPGPPSSRMQDKCYVVEGWATDSITVSASLASQYDHHFRVPHGSSYYNEWPQEPVAANAFMQSGYLKPTVIVHDPPQGEEVMDVSDAFMQSGAYNLIVVVHDPVQGKEIMDVSDAYMQSGSYVHRVIEAATQGGEVMDVSNAYMSGGSYNAV